MMELLETRALLSGVSTADPAGTLLPFGPGGQTVYRPAGDTQVFTGAAVALADGRVMTASITTNPGGQGVVLARYNVDGTSDRTFGTAFVPLPDVGSLGQGDAVPIALATYGRTGYVVAVRSGADVAVLRVNGNGQLVNGFGSNAAGLARVDLGGKDVPIKLVVDHLGRVMIFGITGSLSSSDPLALIPPGPAQTAVARLTSAGAPDTTFGTGGVLALTLPGSRNALADAAVDDQGRYLLAVNGDTLGAVVARFTPAGTLDTSWGDHGLARQPADGMTQVGALTAGGRGGSILIAGSRGNVVIVERLTAGGAIDPTFGRRGLGQLKVNNGALTNVVDMTVLKGGRIVVGARAGGYVQRKGRSITAMAAAAFTPTGTPDLAFGDAGRALVSISGGIDQPAAVVGVGRGRTVLVGAGDPSRGPAETILAGLDATGARRAGFGTNGVARHRPDPDGETVVPVSVARAASGDTYVLATQHDGDAQRTVIYGFASNGYPPNGMQFANAQPLVVEPAGHAFTPAKLLLSADQSRLAVVGTTGTGFAVVMYKLADDSSGAFVLDEGYGTHGLAAFPPPAGEGWQASTAIFHGGKIVVGGTRVDMAEMRGQWTLARFTATGAIDTTFGGGDGWVRTRFTVSGSADNTSALRDLAIQADGKIVAAGEAEYRTGIDWGATGHAAYAVARYTADGLPDASFGTAGAVTGPVDTDVTYVNSVKLDYAGKIVLCGTAGQAGAPHQTTDFGLVRLHADGTPDATFGTAGHASVDLGSSNDDAVEVLIQSDGRLVVIGTTSTVPAGPNPSSEPRFAAARFNADGSVDTSFGTAGHVTAPPQSSTPFVVDAAMLYDGSVITWGYTPNGRTAGGSLWGTRFDTGVPLIARQVVGDELVITGTPEDDCIGYFRTIDGPVGVFGLDNLAIGDADKNWPAHSRIRIEGLGGDDVLSVGAFGEPANLDFRLIMQPVTLNGGGGDDLLVGGPAADRIDGGPGFDRTKADGQDTVTGVEAYVA